MIKDLSSNLISASADLLKQGADDKEAYQKFFNGMLKKYGVRSPAELSGDKKKEFYNDIEKGWKHDEAVTESTIPLPGTDDYEDEYGEDINEKTEKEGSMVGKYKVKYDFEANEFGFVNKQAKKDNEKKVGGNKGIQKMIKQGKTIDQISKEYGMFKDAVKTMAKGLRLGEDITEATWKVQISDWPPIYLDGKSEGAIRAGLRKSLKDPKAIKSIEKVTKSDHKKGVMKRISGKDDEKAAEE